MSNDKPKEAIEETTSDFELAYFKERTMLLAKIERGIQQADAGETISHENLKSLMAKWLA